MPRASTRRMRSGFQMRNVFRRLAGDRLPRGRPIHLRDCIHSGPASRLRRCQNGLPHAPATTKGSSAWNTATTAHFRARDCDPTSNPQTVPSIAGGAATRCARRTTASDSSVSCHHMRADQMMRIEPTEKSFDAPFRASRNASGRCETAASQGSRSIRRRTCGWLDILPTFRSCSGPMLCPSFANDP